MSVERELLKGAVEWMHELQYVWANVRDSGDYDVLDLIADIKRIENLLAQPEQTEQEPVATKLESHQFTAFHVSADDFKKLQKLPTGTKIYTAPPKREPLSNIDIKEASRNAKDMSFYNGVKWAEIAHGIGGEE